MFYMKYTRLIYSDFVPSRPESTSLLELWCLLGGAIIGFYVLYDSGTGVSGKPRLEMILSLALPGAYFYINYLARYISWMRVVLFGAIILSIAGSGHMLFFPEEIYRSLPNSNIVLIIFSSVALFLVPEKRTSNNKM